MICTLTLYCISQSPPPTPPTHARTHVRTHAREQGDLRLTPGGYGTPNYDLEDTSRSGGASARARRARERSPALKKVNTNRRIYVSGLPSSASETQLQIYFGQIGVISRNRKDDRGKNRRGFPDQWPFKITIFREGGKTGAPKGDCTVTYEDPNAAATAPSFFDGKTFPNGGTQVSLFYFSLSHFCGARILWC